MLTDRGPWLLRKVGPTEPETHIVHEGSKYYIMVNKFGWVARNTSEGGFSPEFYTRQEAIAWATNAAR